jgi:hypothetical protein
MNREGVTVFVLDSGINFSHKDFEGRASNSANFVSTEDEQDYAGHGKAFRLLLKYQCTLSVNQYVSTHRDSRCRYDRGK